MYDYQKCKGKGKVERDFFFTSLLVHRCFGVLQICILLRESIIRRMSVYWVNS